MEQISLRFTESGFCYEQIQREGMGALYTQTRLHSGVVRYEVVRLGIQRAHTWPDGTETPEKEAYPPASAWGQRGWTFHTLPDAQAHFARLQTMSVEEAREAL